jgi:hypothetical protein
VVTVFQFCMFVAGHTSGHTGSPHFEPQALEGDGDAAISSWYYTWPSYYELLRDWGVRSLEIDVYYDNVGGTSRTTCWLVSINIQVAKRTSGFGAVGTNPAACATGLEARMMGVGRDM